MAGRMRVLSPTGGTKRTGFSQPSVSFANIRATLKEIHLLESNKCQNKKDGRRRCGGKAVGHGGR